MIVRMFVCLLHIIISWTYLSIYTFLRWHVCQCVCVLICAHTHWSCFHVWLPHSWLYSQVFSQFPGILFFSHIAVVSFQAFLTLSSLFPLSSATKINSRECGLVQNLPQIFFSPFVLVTTTLWLFIKAKKLVFPLKPERLQLCSSFVFLFIYEFLSCFFSLYFVFRAQTSLMVIIYYGKEIILNVGSVFLLLELHCCQQIYWKQDQRLV